MKRYIYLISPQKIRGVKFYKELNNVLKTNKVKYFQLRLKKISTSNLLKISRKVKKIAKKNNVKFLINDKPIIAKKVGADGCHIGQKDTDFIISRKILGKNKIIGVTCHNSKKLALIAKEHCKAVNPAVPNIIDCFVVREFGFLTKKSALTFAY